ncbi:hypothetical protein NEMIN01_0427 [Nematocida minor]|uniref:uncharacterized protein n=1 Tax=Nematocida minor TaxID=1912983 RepID=UPI0022211E32|nr:uncharacterized protein NEMIN01_0427 [Nematocida minor]KAI5189364.1 hypothetical protein NEMIN01_0427 [Nematocida minor]
MLERVWKWMGGESAAQQEDLRVFFEETTSLCFKECVKPSRFSFLAKKTLTEKEKKCVTACTLKKVQLFMEIEEELAKKFSK